MKTSINKLKINKYIISFIFILVGVLGIKNTYAADTINMYLFWGEGCPHCKKENEFLQDLVKNNEDLALYDYEVYKSQDGRSKLMEAEEKLNLDVGGVPFLVIGNKHIVGFLSPETTGQEIIRIIDEYRESGCYDILNFEQQPEEVNSFPENVTNIIENNDPVIESSSFIGSTVDPTTEVNIENSIEEDNVNADVEKTPDDNEEKIEQCEPGESVNKPALPKFANIDLEKLSLPALTIVLGFLDGFNPCAMWVLLFLISLLIGMQDKKKMWILGIAFIMSSASVYMLFMVAWLNLFMFVGYIVWIRVFIAGIALLGGYSSLKKFLSKDSSGCDVVGDEKRRNVFEKLGKITSNKSLWVSIIGIAALAFAVNLVELVCSAGLPAVYTQVLVLNNLGKLQYCLYILLYTLFFMFDDLFVFFVAMKTLQMTGITTKYVKWSRLVGGILMVAIGLLLLFRPEILMFG